MTDSKKAGKAVFVIATFFGLGYAPVASGTAGSAGAVVLFILAGRLWWPWYIGLWLVLFAIAVYTSQKVQDAIGEDDPSIVVIDEVVGYLAAMFLLPVSAGYIATGFFIFRLLDIIKPFPASYFDKKVKNGLGIVMDDVIAGIFTCVILHLFRLAWG
jgi:phosphatidylglycerophosphatase A